MTAVRFLGLGYGEFEDVTLEVNYIAQWARGYGRFDPCVLCAGDPLAEQPCECGGGYIRRVRTGEVPEPGIPLLHTYKWGSEQHIPHAPGCTVVTYIDRWWASAPTSAETCPVCEGRPT